MSPQSLLAAITLPPATSLFHFLQVTVFVAAALESEVGAVMVGGGWQGETSLSTEWIKSVSKTDFSSEGRGLGKMQVG